MKNPRTFLKDRLPFIKTKFSFFLCIFTILSCVPRQATVQNYGELNDLVDKQEFEIEQQWVMPLGGSMIDLAGSPNFIRFKGEEVNIFLPYFGVRHAGGSYGSDETGIVYKGEAINFDIIEEPGEKITINFEGRQGNESLRFEIIMYAGGDANTSVTSTQRNRISYRGQVKTLPENLK